MSKANYRIHVHLNTTLKQSPICNISQTTIELYKRHRIANEASSTHGRPAVISTGDDATLSVPGHESVSSLKNSVASMPGSVVSRSTDREPRDRVKANAPRTMFTEISWVVTETQHIVPIH